MQIDNDTIFPISTLKYDIDMNIDNLSYEKKKNRYQDDIDVKYGQLKLCTNAFKLYNIRFNKSISIQYRRYYRY